AILLLQGDEFAAGIYPSVASGVLQKHQRKQAGVLCFVRQQLAQYPTQTNSFRAQIASQQTLPSTRSITLIENQIDDGLHCDQTCANDFERRNLVRNLSQANFLLRSHQALGQRCFRQEKCVGNLGCGESTKCAQRESDLSLATKRRVAASEDQT